LPPTRPKACRSPLLAEFFELGLARRTRFAAAHGQGVVPGGAALEAATGTAGPARMRELPAEERRPESGEGCGDRAPIRLPSPAERRQVDADQRLARRSRGSVGLSTSPGTTRDAIVVPFAARRAAIRASIDTGRACVRAGPRSSRPVEKVLAS
jgi:hypothetical protein